MDKNYKIRVLNKYIKKRMKKYKSRIIYKFYHNTYVVLGYLYSGGRNVL